MDVRGKYIFTLAFFRCVMSVMRKESGIPETGDLWRESASEK